MRRTGECAFRASVQSEHTSSRACPCPDLPSGDAIHRRFELDRVSKNVAIGGVPVRKFVARDTMHLPGLRPAIAGQRSFDTMQGGVPQNMSSTNLNPPSYINRGFRDRAVRPSARRLEIRGTAKSQVRMVDL